MNNAVLYNECNAITRRDVHYFLQEFGPNMKWKQNGEKIIDIGCGDGSVTVDILSKFIPPNYKKMVGCDISEEMVKFANENYSSSNIEFSVLDIEGQLPENKRNSFDHVFSFYTIQWIRDQEKTFTNIYELLAEGGACLLMFLGHMPIYDLWRSLARMNRWRHYLKDVERFVGAYHDIQEPEIRVQQIMKKIGFTNIEIIRRPLNFTYETVDFFKRMMTALNPFIIPKEMLPSYLDDMVNELRCINKANVNIKGPINETFYYDLLIVSGNK